MRVISVNGYRAFTGVLRIIHKDKPNEEIFADWLYRPDTNCWYCQDASFPAEQCVIVG